MCEQILKKRQRPNTIQILWIVKNQEKANNSPSYRCAAIKHNQLNVGRIALERLVGALINWSLLQSGGGGLNGTKKFNSGLQITILEVNI